MPNVPGAPSLSDRSATRETTYTGGAAQSGAVPRPSGAQPPPATGGSAGGGPKKLPNGDIQDSGGWVYQLVDMGSGTLGFKIIAAPPDSQSVVGVVVGPDFEKPGVYEAIGNRVMQIAPDAMPSRSTGPAGGKAAAPADAQPAAPTSPNGAMAQRLKMAQDLSRGANPNPAATPTAPQAWARTPR